MTIQVAWFTNSDDLNLWLKRNADDMEYLKFYSSGPNYFFVVYEEAKK